jgi:hypothetical protein
VLVAVEQGNSKPWFEYPESPRPDRFDLAFPNDEPYIEAGVAGRPVPSWLLAPPHIGTSFDFTSRSWNISMINLIRQLTEQGVELLRTGGSQEGLRYLIAARELALKLSGNRNADTTWAILGFNLARVPDQHLAELAAELLSPEQTGKLDRTRQLGVSFRSRLKAVLETFPEIQDHGPEFFGVLDELHAYDERNRDLMRWLFDHPDLPECSFLNHY